MLKEKKGYLSIPFSIGIAGIILASAIVGSLIGYFFLQKYLGIEETIAVLLEVILDNSLLFLVLYLIRKKKTGIKSINFSLVRNNKWIIPLIILAAISLSHGIVLRISDYMPTFDFVKTIWESMPETDLPILIAAVIIGPIGEELIYRGIILDGLLDRYSAWKAIIISSFIFSITHVIPDQVLIVFPIALFLGWVYYHTNRSLTYTIILHITINLFNSLEFYLFGEGGLVKAVDTWVYIAVVIVGSSIFIISIWQLRKIFHRQKYLQPEVEK
jgi:membrane protease YdiL (CAAX protease family)